MIVAKCCSYWFFDLFRHDIAIDFELDNQEIKIEDVQLKLFSL